MTDFEEQTGATDIIDATQNAVIDAVNSVSELIEKQVQESTFEAPATAHEAFYLSAEFWVGVAFVVAVLMICKPAFKALKSLLEKRRNNIIKTLDEAEDLLIEAQKLFATHERQFQNAPAEIKTMAAQAAEEINAYALQKNQALDNELTKKKKEAENIMRTAVEEARAQMRLAVSQKTIKIVNTYIKQNFNAQTRADMIDESIKRIVAKL